jgi:hypothetical protein
MPPRAFAERRLIRTISGKKPAEIWLRIPSFFQVIIVGLDPLAVH